MLLVGEDRSMEGSCSTCNAGDGRSDVTKVWLKWYKARENTSSEEAEEQDNKM